jgi:Tol biopolymer transport system component
VFSADLDVSGDTGVGTEIYTMDFDAAAVAAGTPELDLNVQRVTFTVLEEGDPISGVLNSDPCWSPADDQIYFVSTRRAPTTTLHDRNIWRVPADGSQDPEIYFFSRYDDLDPTMLPDGRLLMSSMVGFPTDMLNRLQEEAYQNYKQENEDEHAADPDNVPLLNEIELRKLAKAAREDLMLFGGVMSHIYLYR